MSTRRGNGFVHLNTPAAISYSPGQQLSLSDLRQSQNREECVALPPSVGIWRAAFRQYVKTEGLAPFARDAEAERDGEGPILPPLLTPATGKKGPFAPKAAHPPVAADAAATTASNSANSELPSNGITIVSHHKISGERQFVYPDHDGVLSTGFIPRVVVSAEEKAEMEADRKYYISPQSMSEVERTALEELQALWKSRSTSHSVQGAQHRSMAGNAIPGETEVTGDDERTALWREGEGPPRQRVRHERREAVGESDAQRSDEDALDEALRLAGELLDTM